MSKEGEERVGDFPNYSFNIESMLSNMSKELMEVPSVKKLMEDNKKEENEEDEKQEEKKLPNPTEGFGNFFSPMQDKFKESESEISLDTFEVDEIEEVDVSEEVSLTTLIAEAETFLDESIDLNSEKDFQNLVKNYEQEVANIVLTCPQYIEPRVTVPNYDEDYSLLYKNMNLQDKIIRIERHKKEIFTTLTDNLSQVRLKLRDKLDEYKDKATTLEIEINTEVTLKADELRAKAEKYIQEIESQFELELIKFTQITDMDQHIELIEKAVMDINELTKTIEEIIGEQSEEDTKDTYQIPNNMFELEEEIDKINKQLSKFQDLNNRSYYQSTLEVVGKIYSYPFKKINDTTLRMILILFFILVTGIMLSLFNTYVVFGLLTVIVLDILFQIQVYNSRTDLSDCFNFIKHSGQIKENIVELIKEERRRQFKIENEEKVEKIKHQLENYLNTVSNVEAETIALIEEKDLVSKAITSIEQITRNKVTEINNVNMKYNEEISDIKTNNEKQELAHVQKELNKIKITDPIQEPDFKLSWDPNFTLGKVTQDKYSMNLTRTLKEGSYLITYDNDEQFNKALIHLKHLILQSFWKIQPEYLKLNIIDNKRAGADMVDLVCDNKEITKVIDTDKDLSDLIEEQARDLTHRVTTALRVYENVTEYNEARARTGAVTFPYILNVWINYSPELVKNNEVSSFLTQGKNTGMINVFFFNNKHKEGRGQGEEDPEMIEALSQFDNTICTTKCTFNGEPFLKDLPHLTVTQNEYSKELGVTKMVELIDYAKGYKQNTVLFKDLKEKISKERWTKTTLDGIDLCVGYRDGDLTQPEYFHLGDKPVHGLMAGSTGMGKSNTLNVMISNLINTYSPDWLELVMVDFKMVEFKIFTEDYHLPHCSLIAGTSDAEYSLSVFKYIMDEMEKRQKIFADGITYKGEKTVFKNIKEYNKFIIENKITDTAKIMPRILTIFDEFQVMFEIDDEIILDEIKQKIKLVAKLGRALGIHLFFTSQSMDGTLADDVKAQFALRACLGTTSDTSTSILGNDAASINMKQGWIYINDSLGGEKENNRLFRTPFIPTDYLKENIIQVQKLCKERKTTYHYADYYDEEKKHYEEELKELTVKIKNKRDAILLGEQVAYSPHKVPENFVVGADDGDHVVICANDKIERANLVNTFIENFRQKERTKLHILNFDRTLDGLIRDQYSDATSKIFNRATDCKPFLEGIVSSITGTEDYDELLDDMPPEVQPYDPTKHDRHVVFFIGLEKSIGFKDDYPDQQYQDLLTTLLREGPMQGVNIILVTNEKMKRFFNLFNYRISGKVSVDTSYELFESKVGNNLNERYAAFKSTVDDRQLKFKQYQFDYDEKYLKSKFLEVI